LVQVEFLTLDKVNFSKSEYDLSVVLVSFDQYLGKSEKERDQEVGQVYSRVRYYERFLYRCTVTRGEHTKCLELLLLFCSE
jgi:hypothetical protein